METYQLNNVFIDDHETCCNFSYKGNKFSLWWTFPEAIAAFSYRETPQAQEILQPMSLVLDRMIEANGNKETYDSREDEYRHTGWGFLDHGWNE